MYPSESFPTFALFLEALELVLELELELEFVFEDFVIVLNVTFMI